MTTTFVRKIMLGTAIAASMGIGYAIGAQPHMEASIGLLQNARAELAAATPNKGGHREKALGLICCTYYKDPSDPRWKNDAGVKQWREFMTKQLPGADLNDAFYAYGSAAVMTMIPVLKQCGNDFSRENLMKQAANLTNVEVPLLLPGIKVNTSPTNYHTIGQVQMMRWTGKSWDLFGDVLGADSI